MLDSEDPSSLAFFYSEEGANTLVSSRLPFSFSKFSFMDHPPSPQPQLGWDFCDGFLLSQWALFVHFSPCGERDKDYSESFSPSCHLGDDGPGNPIAGFLILGPGFIPYFHREPYIQVGGMDWTCRQRTPVPPLKGRSGSCLASSMGGSTRKGCHTSHIVS